MEQARGDDKHNIVTVVMIELGVGINGAFKWVEQYHDELVSRSLRAYSNLPWRKETHPGILRYIDGLMNWVRANDSWSFESLRYFGEEGSKISESRVVTLLPRISK